MTNLLHKVQRRLAEEVAATDRLARVKKLLPAHRPPTPFLIVAFPRTGSTMLRAMLDSHPNVRCYYELFHSEKSEIPFSVPGWDRASKDPALLRLREKDPRAFLEQTVYGPHSPAVLASGWKLIHGQEEHWGGDNLIRAVMALDNLKVIHMHRRNTLEILVSLEEAQQSGRWGTGATGGARDGKAQKVRLDPETTEERFRRIRQRDEDTRERWREHPYLEVDYDTLSAEPDRVGAELLDFLDIPQRPLQTRTKKTGSRSLADRLANYEELAEKFAGTKWESFFGES